MSRKFRRLFLLTVFLLSLSILSNWFANLEKYQDKSRTNLLDCAEVKLFDSELDKINIRVQKMKRRIAELEKAELHAAVSNLSKVAPPLPGWVEQFTAPHWSDFKSWRGVFVFFVTYRHEYLRACLESIAKASANIDESSVCVFALDKRPEKLTTTDVNKTLEVIQKVTFCKVFVWEVNSDRGRTPEKDFTVRLKHHWWFVLESVFNSTVTGNKFNGSLQGYKNDILFIEEDTVFAPDFIPVMWFSSEVKRLNSGIIQLALGSWSGENMINAHPDTFVVRTSRELRGIAYGLNQSNWLYFKSLEKDFFEDGQRDWCESMGLVLGKQNGMKGFRIVVPTLSRIWHIGRKGLGLGGDFLWDRPVTSQPNWEYASRLIHIKTARVNPGIRDLLGFLCKKRINYWFLDDMECPFSMARFKGKDRNRILCAKQPHITDICDVYV